MPERRRFARRREGLQARILFNDRKSGFGCVLKEFSATGARVGVSEKDRVPDELELYVPQKQKAFPARVRWRNANEMGLIFVDALRKGEGSSTVSELQNRAERLEGEIATLTEQVRRLTAEVARARL